MLFFGLGVNEDIIDENYDELVEVVHENFIHEVHEVGGGIGQSKGHYCVLKQSVTGGECSLGDILFSDLQLMVPGTKIDLGEDSGSIHLVDQILDLCQRVLVFMVTSFNLR